MAKQSKLGADPLEGRKGLSWLVPKDAESAEETGGESNAAPEASPPAPRRRARNASHEGLAEGYKRHTFIVPEGLLRQIKEIAFHEDRTVKDVVEEALNAYVQKRRSR